MIYRTSCSERDLRAASCSYRKQWHHHHSQRGLLKVWLSLAAIKQIEGFRKLYTVSASYWVVFIHSGTGRPPKHSVVLGMG